MLPKTNKTLRKYISEDQYLLPGQAMRDLMAMEIADVVGIDKNLTHHIARKTFATTVLLYNDVPMKVVSELLGHSKMATTQMSYCKIIQKKVGEEMKMLNGKLGS